jgi:NADH pyrophosphatase NudC (nudix superfamily)
VVGDELDDVRWFDADAVREGLTHDWSAPPDDTGSGIVLSAPISIARWLIEQWLATGIQRR